jgi:Putative prokaryotic signal transducing protein
MAMVTVLNTFNPAEAQLIRSLLEAEGLQPEIKNELSALSMEGYAMAVGGVEVQVPADEADEARALIAARDQPPT